MRLINVDTYKVDEFFGDRIPPYAILSHCWVDGEEVSFQDIQNLNEAKLKRGFNKIEECCRQAKDDGLSYAWVDTCCIDKTSSAELSEAINSMFAWYSASEVCYAYLEDVESRDAFEKSIDKILVNIRWFSRGWTLQELIAPFELVFFTKNWDRAGSRDLFQSAIHRWTGIPPGVLDKSVALEDIPAATRMTWASTRTTSRQEDEAYCLLGIFDVRIPLLYGEGGLAFQRLQEEILRVTHDQTIFLYDEFTIESTSTGKVHVIGSDLKRRLFAQKPSQFHYCSSKFRPVKCARDPNPTPSSRERGIKLNLRLTKLESCLGNHPYLSMFQQSTPCPMYLAGLDCSVEDDRGVGTAIAIILQRDDMEADQDHDRIFTRYSDYHVLIPCKEIATWEFSTCYIRNSKNESHSIYKAELMWKTENDFGYGQGKRLDMLSWQLFPPGSTGQSTLDAVRGVLLDQSPNLPWLLITLSLADQGEMVSCDIWTVHQAITDKVLADERKSVALERARKSVAPKRAQKSVALKRVRKRIARNRARKSVALKTARMRIVSRVQFWAMFNHHGGPRLKPRVRDHGLLARGSCWISDTLEATVSVMGDDLSKVYIHIREHSPNSAPHDIYNMTQEHIEEAWRHLEVVDAKGSGSDENYESDE